VAVRARLGGEAKDEGGEMKDEEKRTGVSDFSFGAAHSSGVTQVAAAVILDSNGRFLLAQRPAGKPYAGYWEFPG